MSSAILEEETSSEKKPFPTVLCLLLHVMVSYISQNALGQPSNEGVRSWNQRWLYGHINWFGGRLFSCRLLYTCALADVQNSTILNTVSQPPPVSRTGRIGRAIGRFLILL